MSSCSKICCCSVTMSCPTLCKPMNYSLPGSSVLPYLLEFAQNTQFIAGAQKLRAVTIIFYLAASGLSCSTQDLSASCKIFLWGSQTLSLQNTGLLHGMWDLSSPTREQTYYCFILNSKITKKKHKDSRNVALNSSQNTCLQCESCQHKAVPSLTLRRAWGPQETQTFCPWKHISMDLKVILKKVNK